jgi:hypothetical protein
MRIINESVLATALTQEARETAMKAIADGEKAIADITHQLANASLVPPEPTETETPTEPGTIPPGPGVSGSKYNDPPRDTHAASNPDAAKGGP